MEHITWPISVHNRSCCDCPVHFKSNHKLGAIYPRIQCVRSKTSPRDYDVSCHEVKKMNDSADDIEFTPRGINSLFHCVIAFLFWESCACYHAINTNYVGPLENSLKCLSRKKHKIPLFSLSGRITLYINEHGPYLTPSLDHEIIILYI